MKRLTAVLASLLAVGLLAAGCGSDDSDPIDAGAAPAASQQDTEPAGTTPPDDEGTEVTVYFTRGERLTSVRRMVPEKDNLNKAAEQAVQALLDGPTDAERAAGLGSQIPDGTRFLGLTIARDRIATVDLSSEFESGGGSLSMTARLAQVACTLDNVVALDIADGTLFKLDGKPVKVFSGEGIVLDGPVTCADYADLLR